MYGLDFQLRMSWTEIRRKSVKCPEPSFPSFMTSRIPSALTEQKRAKGGGGHQRRVGGERRRLEKAKTTLRAPRFPRLEPGREIRQGLNGGPVGGTAAGGAALRLATPTPIPAPSRQNKRAGRGCRLPLACSFACSASRAAGARPTGPGILDRR